MAALGAIAAFSIASTPGQLVITIPDSRMLCMTVTVEPVLIMTVTVESC